MRCDHFPGVLGVDFFGVIIFRGFFGLFGVIFWSKFLGQKSTSEVGIMFWGYVLRGLASLLALLTLSPQNFGSIFRHEGEVSERIKEKSCVSLRRTKALNTPEHGDLQKWVKNVQSSK